MVRRVEGPTSITGSSTLRAVADFPFLFFFSFFVSFLFSYFSCFLLYIAKVFQIYKFSFSIDLFYFNFLPFPGSPSRGPAIHLFLL